MQPVLDGVTQVLQNSFDTIMMFPMEVDLYVQYLNLLLSIWVLFKEERNLIAFIEEITR